MLKPIALVLALTFIAAAPACAQPPNPAPALGPIDGTARAAAVTAAAKALRDRYVFPDVAEKAALKIEANLASGAYDGLGDPVVFADRLTNDLAEVAHDKHMRVSVAGGPPPPILAKMGRPPLSEFGVVRADRLPGGVGYIEISGFPPPEVFNPAATRAMAALAGSKAIIVDVRRNGGGSPDSVAYLASFFFDDAKPRHLNDLIWRNAGTKTFRTQTFYTTHTPTKFIGVPVYLLTSEFTFSGGEEFSYDMQTQKRAVLVGDVTGGGANPGGVQPIGPGLMIFMPAGRAQNPITKTSWEGRGVAPEIVVPHEDALRVALQRLGHPQSAGTVEALSQERVFAPHTTPTAASEAAARRLLAEAASQQFRYDLMTPQLAETIRNDIPTLKAQIDHWGNLQSLTFRRVDPGGADVYDVKFANGGARLVLVLTADGKAMVADLRPS